MNQKIWVIEDNHEKQVSAARISQSSIPAFQQQSTKQRDPSLAYSLSIIIWGCGQFYNKQWKLGILFLLFMINFYLFTSITVIYWGYIRSCFEAIYVDRSEALLICAFFYLTGIIVWYFNAWQAYFNSLKDNAGTHKSSKITLLPAVCSLLMPGWGQLLNGQIKKSLFFQLSALTGLASSSFILIVFSVWPTLELSRSRSIIEWIFSISIILSPFILMIWIISIFDAAKVSMDNKIKKPLSVRIKSAKNKFRYHVKIYGWKNALLPLIKRKVLIILVLTFCVIAYHQIPRNFYMQKLQHIGNQMSEKEMTIIPNIIKKLPGSISSGT